LSHDRVDAERHQRAALDGDARVFAMSRDGLFTKRAAVVNEGGTPPVSLFLSALVALLFIVFGEKFEIVITVLAFFFVVNYILSFVSLFVLRYREPDKPRPYRAWGYPVTPALALIGSVLFLVGAIRADTKQCLRVAVVGGELSRVSCDEDAQLDRHHDSTTLVINLQRPVSRFPCARKQLAIRCANLFLIALNQSHDTWTSAAQGDAEQTRHSREGESFGESGHE
jgi:amino acid transporter